MKLLVDFLPIVLFFIAFKLGGLIIATQTAIVASLLQLLWVRWKTGKFENMQLISFATILILGGSTIIFQNELFIKWKPTAVYWLLAIVLIMSQLLGKQPLLQKFGNSNIKLSDEIWRKLNMSWGIFFIFMGLTNLYVIYNFDTDVWVNFKLFGTFGITLLFAVAQGIYMVKKSQAQNGN